MCSSDLRKTNVEAEHIMQLGVQLQKALSLDPVVKDAAIQKALHIMKTMTSLLKSFGYVNLAINNDIKN